MARHPCRKMKEMRLEIAEAREVASDHAGWKDLSSNVPAGTGGYKSKLKYIPFLCKQLFSGFFNI